MSCGTKEHIRAGNKEGDMDKSRCDILPDGGRGGIGRKLLTTHKVFSTDMFITKSLQHVHKALADDNNSFSIIFNMCHLHDKCNISSYFLLSKTVL